MMYDAIIFDLLTALIDSWTTWNQAAGSAQDGLRWRREYLRLTYGCGPYRPYEDIVREAATNVGLPETLAARLDAAWTTLEPWPEAPEVLGGLAERGVRLAVATNCSIRLGHAAAGRVGVEFDVIVTAEEAGWYKPRPEPYRAVLDRLGTTPARTLFVAGSPADVPGAAGVGMPVFWHNRAGLPPIPGDTPPLMTADTLRPLLHSDQWSASKN
jgi:2-haloalkanoic acid dehalogenase type II